MYGCLATRRELCVCRTMLWSRWVPPALHLKTTSMNDFIKYIYNINDLCRTLFPTLLLLWCCCVFFKKQKTKKSLWNFGKVSYIYVGYNSFGSHEEIIVQHSPEHTMDYIVWRDPSTMDNNFDMLLGCEQKVGPMKFSLASESKA